MTLQEQHTRELVVRNIMSEEGVSLTKAISILREWEKSGLIFFTSSGQFRLLKMGNR
ncbi:hypothetical protein [Streptococcus suis]|uniref:hypothetical protein n=1 Tax=Streptococcus suis TaxID=1307 RepID=UPI001ABE5DF0|nr:hypothetical protein [Streptococcus suis]MBO4112845.1 hypothetical protein [Streptococcus suis]